MESGGGATKGNTRERETLTHREFVVNGFWRGAIVEQAHLGQAKMALEALQLGWTGAQKK